LSKLKAKVVSVKSYKAKTYAKEFATKAKDAEKTYNNPPPKGAPAWKFYPKRKL